MALFSNRQNAPTSDNLIEIPAGKCSLRATGVADQREVVSQSARGLLYIRQSEDQLIHFCWKNRESGQVVDDLIVFPGDTTFVKVTECPAEAGRVFMHKFINSGADRWLLFWMQDADASKDQQRLDRVNQLLNYDTDSASTQLAGRTSGTPAAATTTASGRRQLNDQLANVQTLLGLPPASVTPEELSALAGIDLAQLQQMMGSADASALASGLGGMLDPSALSSSPAANVTPARPSGTSTATPAAPGRAARGAAAGNQAVHLRDLQNLLSALPSSATQGGAASHANLEDVVAGSNVSDTVANSDNAARLLPLLPTEGGATQDQTELNATIRSPQYRQAARVFGEALSSGQLGPVMQQFGLPADVVSAATAGDLTRMAEALQSSETGVQTSGSQEGTLASATASESSTINTNVSSTPSAEREPEPKRSKAAGDKDPEDNMELD